MAKTTPGQEAADAFVWSVTPKLWRQAGGDAPAPLAPTAPELIALESPSGNELLMALREQRETLAAKLKTWRKRPAMRSGNACRLLP